jgi:hypothetical protein
LNGLRPSPINNWLSLVMLLLTALFYALLRMTPALFSSP